MLAINGLGFWTLVQNVGSVIFGVHLARKLRMEDPVGAFLRSFVFWEGHLRRNSSLLWCCMLNQGLSRGPPLPVDKYLSVATL